MRDAATGRAPRKRRVGDEDIAPVTESTPALNAEPSSRSTVSMISSPLPPTSTLDITTECGLVVPSAMLLFCSSTPHQGAKLRSHTVESLHPTGTMRLRLLMSGQASVSSVVRKPPLHLLDCFPTYSLITIDCFGYLYRDSIKLCFDISFHNFQSTRLSMYAPLSWFRPLDGTPLANHLAQSVPQAPS